MDDDGEDKDDTKRKSRNLSEKKRRDQFNMLVNELSSMVATGARKMDKSTVLRSTISFLKNHNEIAIRSRAHEIQEDWKPAFLSNEEFTHLILEALDGFIVVFSAAGHVHYVSESVTALLGHLPSELLNTSVYELVWDEEQAALYQALVGGGGGGGDNNSGTLAFQAHLRRGRPLLTEDTYELVNFQGYLRTDVDTLDTPPTYTADTRFFVGTGRLHTPQLIREMSLVDPADVDSRGSSTSSREFTSRHSLEWKFLFLDHRAPPIIGYLPFEVLGTSGYDYYHVDDLDKVVSCHEALMQKGEGTSCYYRFLTKGQQWIWLQTRFYITYHQWNSKPEFIVCTHRVVSYVDVMKQSRKDQHESTTPSGSTGMLDSSPAVATSASGSGASSPWAGAPAPQRHVPRWTPSDCTSMSADSPASMSATRPQGGRTSRLSCHSHNTGSGLGPGPSSGAPQAVLFAEPPPQPQYVAAIPVQGAVLAGFPAPATAVLSPIPQSVDSGSSMGGSDSNPPTAQLQAQLQRKHAELQAIIGQQQAELRRVSEQLLMARLGLLAPVPPQQGHQQHPQQQQQHPQQQQHHQQQQHQQQHHQHPAMLAAVSVPYICNSNVSSTTSAPLGPGVVVIPPRLDDAAAAASMALGQQQAQMLFTQPQPSSSSTHPQ